MVQVASAAPLFEADALVGKEFKKIALADYLKKGSKKGKWVILFFYPLDFTFVCPTEIRGFADQYDDFKDRNCEVIGCSTDSKFSHKAWSEAKDGIGLLPFPLVADFNKVIARDYGVLLENAGFALRGTFIIDPDGILQYMVVHNTNVGRSTEETLRVLDALQAGGMCPVNWKKGQKQL
ncbi:MAG: peroxiredoxin [bacterium]|nr:peroxiredoxin [bacterium]